MMFLSGSAMPFAVLPEGVQRFARLLPTTYLNETYSGVIVRGEGLMTLAGSLAVLLAIGAVGIVLTSMLFRWEGTEPIPRRSLAMIALAFTLTLGVSALAAPAFKMGDMPGARRIEPGPAAGQVLVLRGATVLDGLGGRIVNARVVIRDNKIAEVSLDDDRVPLPEGATVENLHGKFVIPGLFDSHVHWGGSGGVGASPIERTDDRLAHDLTATLAAGVTSVVSLTDNLKEMRALSNEVAAGQAHCAADVLFRSVDHREGRASVRDVLVRARPRGAADAPGRDARGGARGDRRARSRARRHRQAGARTRASNRGRCRGCATRCFSRRWPKRSRAACAPPFMSAPTRMCGWRSTRAPTASSTPRAA